MFAPSSSLDSASFAQSFNLATVLQTPYTKLKDRLVEADGWGLIVDGSNIDVTGSGIQTIHPSRASLLLVPFVNENSLAKGIQTMEGYAIAISILNSNPYGVDYTPYLSTFRRFYERNKQKKTPSDRFFARRGCRVHMRFYYWILVLRSSNIGYWMSRRCKWMVRDLD